MRLLVLLSGVCLHFSVAEGEGKLFKLCTYRKQLHPFRNRAKRRIRRESAYCLAYAQHLRFSVNQLVNLSIIYRSGIKTYDLFIIFKFTFGSLGSKTRANPRNSKSKFSYYVFQPRYLATASKKKTHTHTRKPFPLFIFLPCTWPLLQHSFNKTNQHNLVDV